MNFVFDYTELNGLIAKKGYTKASLARKLDMSDVAIRNKFNHKSQFKQSDIVCLCSLLGIKPKEISKYFFKR